MTGFTDDEVSAAVDQFLLSQVVVPTRSTGVRDVLAGQKAVYDLLTTALLLKPEAYFYIVFLARNKLMALVSKQLEDLRTIKAAGPSMSRASKQIKSTTDLAAAEASLLELNAGLNSRSSGVRGSIGPAVDRFRGSVASFVNNELVKNVISGGQITQTAEELRLDAKSRWASVVSRHSEIVLLCTGISSALTSFEQVKLPESSVRDIVSRIQSRLGELRVEMSGDSAIAGSRLAMLELLTMRTLLTKASSFRNPELVLMPKLRDSATLTLVDSSGIEAALETTVSGPFNYGVASVLGLSVNGAPVSVPLPGSSRAEIRSKKFTPWVLPGIGDEIAIQVDHAGVVVFVMAAAYANGPAAVAAISAGLGPSVLVTWDSITSQIVIASANSSDVSHVRLITSSPTRQAFRNWAFPVASVAAIEAVSAPVPAADLATAVALASPAVGASARTETLFDFAGYHTDSVGEEATIWSLLDSGTDLVSDGTTAIGSKNFESLGVRAGMGLWASPAYEGRITSVSGSSIVADPAIPAGTLTYRIGPDLRSIPAGARVRVAGSVDQYNNGHFRAVSAGIGVLVLDRVLSSAATGLRVGVFKEVLSLFARGTTTSSSIEVPAPDAGSAALGLPVATPVRASLSMLSLSLGDFLARGVKEGDLITLTAPSGSIYSRTILGAETDRVSIAAPVPHEPGGWLYLVRSSRAAAFYVMQPGVVSFTNAFSSIRRLDSLVARLLGGARYSSEISSGVDLYEQALEDVWETLSAYAVPKEKTIDNVVKTFAEQGFDRALDLLLSLQVTELFTMDPDGVSYVTWMTRKAATVSREVVPVSKLAKSPQVAQEWRALSFQPNPFDPRGDETDG
jgi:hypothetical protein